MTAIDQTMMLLTHRTQKRTDVLLPEVLSYVSNLMRPLLEKIDVLDYTRKSRELKVAEEYAVRLMQPNYPWEEAKRIARQLVENYPTHGFVIDSYESSTYRDDEFGLGLNICCSPGKLDEIHAEMESLIPYLNELTVSGLLEISK
ncbi:hypothetical protein JYT87_02880 [Nitrospira defluvii]|nr:hypothetical protein [Nitrospira defluvii]